MLLIQSGDGDEATVEAGALPVVSGVDCLNLGGFDLQRLTGVRLAAMKIVDVGVDSDAVVGVDVGLADWTGVWRQAHYFYLLRLLCKRLPDMQLRPPQLQISNSIVMMLKKKLI